MIDRFINGCAHDISLRVCLDMYNYVSTVTVNTKNNTQTDVMGASIYETVDLLLFRDPVDERYPHAIEYCKNNAMWHVQETSLMSLVISDAMLPVSSVFG